MKMPDCRSNGAGLGDTASMPFTSRPVSSERNAWRQLLQRLQQLNLSPLAIGPGGEGKAPADLKTGQNLKGWTTTSQTPAGRACACPENGALCYRPGPDAGEVIAFDVEGATSGVLLKVSRCDTHTAPTRQIRRDTDPDRQKVVWRVPDDFRDHLPRNVAKLTTKQPSARGAVDGVNRATYYSADQLVILRNHPASDGQCFWPERYGTEALAEIPPDWWRMALRIEDAEPAPAASRSTGNTGPGNWRSLNRCLICGRRERRICRKQRKGFSILCFQVGTYFPLELKPGEVIIGSNGEWWALTSSRRHGYVSHSKIDDPRERSKASPNSVDELHVIEGSENGSKPRQDRQQKPSGGPGSITYRELIELDLVDHVAKLWLRLGLAEELCREALSRKSLMCVAAVEPADHHAPATTFPTTTGEG